MASATVPSAAYLAQDRGPYILTILGVVGAITLLVVCLRLAVRRFILRFVGPDDYVMASAMLVAVAIYACFIGESNYGLGRHIEAITPDMMTHFLHWIFFHSLLILVGICLAKISICLLLIRLVKSKNYTRFLYTLIGLLSLYTAICMGTIIFACIPVAGNWNPAVRENAKCFTTKVYTNLGLANSIINMFTDVLLAILPIPVIVKLQVGLRTKLALCFVMLLGFVAVGASCMKVKAQSDFLSQVDKFYTDDFFVWAAVELYCAILAASLPMLRPLLVRVLSQARSLTGSMLPRRSSHPDPEDQRHLPHGSGEHELHHDAKSPVSSSSEAGSSAPNTPNAANQGAYYFSHPRQKPAKDASRVTVRRSADLNPTSRRSPSDASDSSDTARGIMRTMEMVTTVTSDPRETGTRWEMPRHWRRGAEDDDDVQELVDLGPRVEKSAV